MLRMHSRQSSPVRAPSQIRYSSNLELSDSGSFADQDWMDGQLERARLQRAPFYRRLTTARRRWDNHHHQEDDTATSALHKFRKSPETEAVDPPHTSWRFYTSFDNGEWRRHAVPVLKTTDVADQSGDVNGLTRYSRRYTEGCSAGESGLRRGRQSRSTAAGEGDTLSAHRRVLSCSMESFRGIAIASGAVCPDSPGGSDYFARDTVRRSLSPRGQTFATSGDVSIFDDRVSIFGDDVTLDDVTRDDDDSPRKRQRPPFVLTGSVKINGVEARLEDKIIVPTKYKNTATGTPEIKISTEPCDRTSGDDDDVTSRKFGRRSVTARRSKAKADEDRAEDKGQGPNCTTGIMGEDRPLKALAKVELENGSLKKNCWSEDGNDSEKISIRSKEQDKNSRLIVGRRSEAVRMREEQHEYRANGNWNGLEGGGLAPKIETRVEIRESRDQINHNTAIGSLSASAAAKDKVTKADDKINPAEDGRCICFSREMDCGTAGSSTVPFELRDGEIQGQNAGKVAEKVADRMRKKNAENVDFSENDASKDQATPRFISVCFVNINSGQKACAGMKGTAEDAGTGRKEVLSMAETKDFSNGKTPEAFDDNEWIVEMAVRD